MEDRFNTNPVGAGTISSSEEERLRRSLFVRSGGSRSSSSTSSGGSGPGGVPFWISHRAVTMRSASDSHRSSCSSSSSSDARGCGGHGGGEVVQSQGAEESLDGGDGGDGGEALGLPENRGDRIVGRVKGNKHCVSKRKGSAAGTREKRSRPLSEDGTHGPEGSPVVSPRGKVVGRRLGFSPSGKEAVETERGDGDSRTDPPGVEDDGGDRSANDELARFRYVRTGVPPLRHSPPGLLKDALGSPQSARGGVQTPPRQMSPVSREPADGEVIKGPPVGSPQGSGKVAMGLNSPSPSIPDKPDGERGPGSGDFARSHGSTPLGAGPRTSVQNSVEPEEEGPLAMGLGASSPTEIPQEPLGQRDLEKSPSGDAPITASVEPEEEGPPAMGLGASSPLETPQQTEGQRDLEKSPNSDAPSPASRTESSPGGEDMEIRCSSDLVDLLIKFSKKPDKTLQDVDFLDVLEMKGIHIPPPRWWRPGGYGPKKE